MSEDPFSVLRNLLSPRYREEGPPSYIEKFLEEGFVDEKGSVLEPMKTVLDLIVLGYRPVTSLCILTIMVESKNRPQTGRQLGILLEKRLGLEEGKLTTGRYYDDRIGRLLKLMCQLGILEFEERPDFLGAKAGYRIRKPIYPAIEAKINSFLKGETLSPISKSSGPLDLKENQVMKQCSRCKALTASQGAIYCELCGAPLVITCTKCNKEILCNWEFCNFCGTRLHEIEHADVRARVVLARKELKVGESLEVEMEFVNVGKTPALLVKITEIVPEGFELAKIPEIYQVEGGHLNMKEKRLDPSKREQVKITLKPKVQGSFPLKPKIVYLDESGKYKSHESKPVFVTVNELGIKGWLKGAR